MSSNDWYKHNKEAKREHQRRWREKNKQKINEYNKKYRNVEDYKEKQSESRKKYLSKKENKMKQMVSLWKKRGVITDDWISVFNLWFETSECMCCDKFLEKGDKCLDHCHKTGEPRAILCKGCNLHDKWINLTA